MDISRESKGAFREYQDRMDAEKEANAEKLNQEVTSAIETSGLEPSPYLVQEVVKRFEIRQDQVQPTSVFKTIPDFLDSYKSRIQKNAQANAVELSVNDRIEQQKVEKKNKYEEMIYFSRTGQHNEYLKAHAAWSAM